MRESSRGLAWLSRIVLLVVMATVVGFAAGMTGPLGVAAQQEDDEEGGAQPANQTVNVELILDSSGSMVEQTTTGETRIDAAKSVLNQVIDTIPDDRGEQINVGFRVFGHRGNNTDAGRAESCASTDLFVPIEGVNKEALREQTNSYQPVGWTPIALALQEAVPDFPDDTDQITNAIILVTDGLETCQAPEETCNAAAALFTGPKVVTVNVVGLGLAEDELAILQCIADNGGGTLVGAQNATELSAALFTFLEELQVISQNGFLEIEVIGGLWPRATITGQGGATDSNPEGEAFTLEMTEPRVELAVGVYSVAWVNPGGGTSTIQVNIEAERTTLIRGSIIEFPQGAGEIYQCLDVGGVVIWQDQFELGDRVWVLPGFYTISILEVVGDPVLYYAAFQTFPGTVTRVDIYTAP